MGANALHEQAHAKDIQHSIQRAYLVKVNFAYGLAVAWDSASAMRPIDGLGILTHLLGYGKMGDEMGNIRQAGMAVGMGMAVAVMRMGMAVAVVGMGMAVAVVGMSMLAAIVGGNIRQSALPGRAPAPRICVPQMPHFCAGTA